MLSCSLSVFLILTIIMFFSIDETATLPNLHPIRHRRHQHNLEDAAESSLTCEQQCQAQFEADFQAEFGSFYVDLHWFPVHPLLTQSESKFKTFCYYAEERSKCFEECGDKNSEFEPAWTPLKHICLLHSETFIGNLPCLRATSDMENCSETCKHFALRYSHLSREKALDDVVPPVVDARGRICYYQLCILECRSRLIDEHCADADIDHTKDFLRRYYAADAVHDSLNTPNSPGLCHTLAHKADADDVAGEKLGILDEGMMREMLVKLDAKFAKRT
uniref:Chondroitin proteoglycan 4 domain-containing protein n=1 Tax=Panagrellus redivivus TaxID=6233 RepID=A0A7E4VJ39_PANRE